MIRKLIHVEFLGAKGIIIGTHSMVLPNTSKKRRKRRRPRRLYRVEWNTPPEIEYPNMGWVSLRALQPSTEVIFISK